MSVPIRDFPAPATVKGKAYGPFRSMTASSRGTSRQVRPSSAREDSSSRGKMAR